MDSVDRSSGQDSQKQIPLDKIKPDNELEKLTREVLKDLSEKAGESKERTYFVIENYEEPFQEYQLPNVEPKEAPTSTKKTSSKINDYLKATPLYQFLKGRAIGRSSSPKEKVQDLLSISNSPKYLQLVERKNLPSVPGEGIFVEGAEEAVLEDGSEGFGNFAEGRLLEGTLFKPDNTQEIGTFADDMLQGAGSRIHADGREEIGTFEKGVLVKGQRLLKDGTLEEGHFVNDQLVGEAEILHPDGVTRDKGHFEGGMLEGPGLRYLHGQILESGTFKAGKLDGEGMRLLEDGSKQQGHFKGGLFLE